MFIVYESSNSIAIIHDTLQNKIAEAGFSLLHFYDFLTLLDEKGFPIEYKAYTYEVCRASMASRMLTQHPIFSTLMPCRISTYEGQGKTYIATLDMQPMLESMKNNDDLYNDAKSLFNQLLEFMKELSH